ncbi:TonB-dependent receptor domain-containing protein [Brevundimonas sp. PAMC22021]|uniref:TonB-dependent receptor domain-containing protein n=1 Tax=Brevundimonas sp. PAMC22021 TaxID=2861285 RepID=UPI001C62FD89|nr:TonB-dependent receptor [Brevundimonas sp. PAMC22021]QYF87233.1 TonB-dependent receptor [Brevundimonas sp. PAMC22021]
MRQHLLATTVLAGILAAGSAVAQTAPASPEQQPPLATAPTGDPEITQEQQLDEIVVTGSRIRRDPTNAPTPLIQVGREALLNTGQTTVIDYLATLPALSNSVVPSDTTGTGLGDGGLSLPNLRSLGSNRTLTLVDGRRHVGSSGGSLAVDVDTIPRLLIENIEIITGGAASVYGADAVSGVLNFVLRKDFEGLEIDANLGMINQDGQLNKRISGLAGKNFLDGRLNVYVHGEYEEVDEVTSNDIDWIDDAYFLGVVDSDRTAVPYDGQVDRLLYKNVLRMDIPRWGQTTLGNVQQPTDLTSPNVAYEDCFSGGAGWSYSPNCYGVTPGKTFWYDGATARPANFGQRIGNVGINRPYNIGGDGENIADFSTGSRVPRSESARFQAGSTFQLTDNIELYGEAKYITEDTFDRGQPTFYDIDLVESYGAGSVNPIYSTNNFDLRWSDNAFLPQNVKDAIRTNTVTPFTTPTLTSPGQPLAPVAAQFARHSLFGPDRYQDNTRELQRYVFGARGDWDQIAFVRDLSWDLGYTYGKVEVENREHGTDTQRFALAADAVVDTAGIVNGQAGQIVCRVQLLDAQGADLDDYQRGGDLRDSEYGRNSIDQCAPLNVFGKGNQSAEAIEYILADIGVTEQNEQQQVLGSISGNLWDFWGAGSIGVAIGGEYRREETSATGRDRDTAGRLLFLNTGPDFLEASYESKEVFAELSIPLFRDSMLGEYAELSGSYRYADYSTVGAQDVYGVNLIYRPIPDIAFKTSFNTSIRVPDLGENFSPFSQTFLNDFTDPCTTQAIIAVNDADQKANRIQNCSALAAQQGLDFDFAGATPETTDDFRPTYTSGVSGVLGGNPALQPEESDSFTFSTVLKPRFIPNFSLVLDYYEIKIDNVISAISAATAAANCVNGPSLNDAACATIFRNNPDIPFGIGAPQGDPVGGFIQGSINYAKLETRGLDFTANYRFDFDEMLGRNWGRLDYSIAGLYLIEQQEFFNAEDPSDFDELVSTPFYPKVRFTSSLTYTPNEIWSVNWTADWQTSQDIIESRDFINNADQRYYYQTRTGNFARHDLTVRWNVREDLSVRAGVVNVFDAEQKDYLGTTLYSNFDPYGRRFFVGLNFRPF